MRKYATRLVGQFNAVLLYEGDSLEDANERRRTYERTHPKVEGQHVDIGRIEYDDEGREVAFDVL